MDDQAATEMLAVRLRQLGPVVRTADEIAAALLPAVRGIAAAELRAAADALTDRARTWVLNELRDRADHLDGQAT